VIQWHLGVID